MDLNNLEINQESYYIVKNSRFFDLNWYKDTYLQDSDEDPILHYLTIGWRKGYNPSPAFSTNEYLHTNSDVAAGGANPLLHYEQYGKYEGRDITSVADENTPLYLRHVKTKAYCTPESPLAHRKSVCELVDYLSTFDVICFDVFDTLLLRNVHQHPDLFRLMGMQLEIEKFAHFRKNAESEAYKIENGGPITIYDIYNVMQKYCTLDSVERLVRYELEMEKYFCIANPYMKSVFEELLARNKIIIFLAESHFSSNLLEELLSSCGYNGYGKILTSCEYKLYASNGQLQSFAMQELGSEKKYICVSADQSGILLGSQTIGWSTHYYRSCNSIGSKFRDVSIDNVVQSIYTSIVNNHLYNGLTTYSKEYEHGFLYGGIIVCGFCEWLNELARRNHHDKIWFLARDMDVVYKAYNSFFKEFDNEYVVTSRLSSYELSFSENTEEYIEFYFKKRANNGSIPLGNALDETDLNILLDYLHKYQLTKDVPITHSNYEKIREMLYSEKETISFSFSAARQGAKKYFNTKIGNASSILLADLGWGGTIFAQLRHFFKKEYSNITLKGALIGANGTAHTSDLISSGFVQTYLFSNTINPGNSFRFEKLEGNSQAMLMEAMFSSNEPTLLKYSLNQENEFELIYGHKLENRTYIDDMQQGILDFCKLYCHATKSVKNETSVSGSDAFAPYKSISKDFDYFYLLFSNVKEYVDGFPILKENPPLTTLGSTLQARMLV